MHIKRSVKFLSYKRSGDNPLKYPYTNEDKLCR